MKDTAPRKKSCRPIHLLAALLAAALVVRVIFLVELERSGLGDVLTLDARLYRDVAHGIVADGRLPAGALTFNPLYPAFLLVMFRLFGEGLLAPRIFQLLVGLATITLVYLAALRLAGDSRERRPMAPEAAVIAAAAAVLFARFVAYEGMLVATTLEIFLFTASFFLALALGEELRGERPMLIGSRRVPPWLGGLVLGALLGAGALGRPNLFLLLIAAVPIWIFFRNRRSRSAAAAAACCLVGAAALLAPPIAFNASRTGRFIPITAHGGINFFIGNDPRGSGLFRPPDDMRGAAFKLFEDAKADAEKETGRAMTQAEVSDFYVGKTFGVIRSDPASWLRLLGRKLVLFFNADVPDLPDVYVFERSLGVFRALFVPFSAIAPLGICGLIVLFRSGRNRSVVSLFLGCAILSVLLFFVNERYRIPATPLFIVLAALCVAWIGGELRKGRLAAPLGMAALAAALFFLVSHRTAAPTTHSAAYAFLGGHYLETGDERKAAEAFAEAYRRDPNRMEAIINYARILRRQERIHESAEMYARAYAREPRFPFLAIEYGLALALLGRHEEARKLYLEALESARPKEKVYACGLLAERAIAEGKREDAISWLRRGLEVDPMDRNLAEMLRKLEGAE